MTEDEEPPLGQWVLGNYPDTDLATLQSFPVRREADGWEDVRGLWFTPPRCWMPIPVPEPTATNQ